jgi:hypothetical protein
MAANGREFRIHTWNTSRDAAAEDLLSRVVEARYGEANAPWRTDHRSRRAPHHQGGSRRL